MNPSLLHVATMRLGAALCGAVLLSACVIIPYPVEPDIQRLEMAAVGGDVRVTLGPRHLLEDVSERIRKLDRTLSVVDGFEFRDAAWPNGGWWLGDLPYSSSDSAGLHGVRYLVLLGPGELDEEIGGSGTGLPGVAIAGSVELRSRLSALVIDLRSGQPVVLLIADARGHRRGAGVIAVAGWTAPMTRSAAIDGIAGAIASTIISDAKSASGQQPLRIALMAAQFDMTWPDDPPG